MNSLSKFYSKEDMENEIRYKYKMSVPPIRNTLNILKNNPNFRKSLDELRKEGWKDWHFLLAITNIGFNYRVNGLGLQHNPKPFWDEFLYKEEPNTFPRVPNELFSVDELKKSIILSILPFLNGKGFSFKGKKIDPQKISMFAGEKFNYWHDDAEHKNIFE